MDTEAPSMSAHPDSATPTRDPLLLKGLPVYATDSSDDEALDYSDDPILEQSYRTLRAVIDAIHNRP